MELKDQVLMDTSGHYHYQGIVAKPFQHFTNRAEWLVVVGPLNEGEHKVWFCNTPSLDVRMICVSAIDWFIKERDRLLNPPAEVPVGEPKI